MSNESLDPGRTIQPPEIAKLLVCRPRNSILIAPEGGFQELERAILQGSLDKYLNDWAIRASEKFHESILGVAISSRLPGIVKALLDRGANPDTALVIQGGTRKYPARGFPTPLALASGSEEMTRMLLKAGADVHLLSRGESPLGYAVLKDIGTIQALLDAGADPLHQGDGDTPLSYATRCLPDDHENLILLRKVAMEKMHGKRLSSLRCKAGKNPVLPSEARGVREFLKFWLGDTNWNWSICLVRANRSDTSSALHEIFDGSELHAPAKAAIFDKGRPIFVVELKGMPWTIVFDEIGARFHDQRLLELSRALSAKLSCEVLGFGLWQGQHHNKGKLLEWNTADWNPEDAVSKMNDDLSDREMNAIEADKVTLIDEWFATRGAFVPKANFVSDGLVITLCLEGIKRKDVVGHDVVIAEKYTPRAK